VFDRRAVRRCLLAAVASVAMWGAARLLESLGTGPAMAAGVVVLALLVEAFGLVTPDERLLLRSGSSRLTQWARRRS
jgi:hypothetical protein